MAYVVHMRSVNLDPGMVRVVIRLRPIRGVVDIKKEKKGVAASGEID